MVLVLIPFLAGYNRPTCPAPPRSASRRSAARPAAQIFHAGKVQDQDEKIIAVRQGKNSRGPSEYQLNLGKLVDTLRSDYPQLFVAPQDLSLFVDAVELHGPSGQRLSGKGQYTAVLDLLRFSRRVAMQDAELTHRITIDGRSVRVRWSAKLWLKDPTLGLTSFQQEPVLVNVDGVSRYDLDGKGHVHLHALENVVMSGDGRSSLLDFSNLEIMWRLPALVPPAASAVPAAGWSIPLVPVPAGAVATTAHRPAAARTTAPHMLAVEETPVERAARERGEDAAKAARLKELRTPIGATKKSGGLPGFLAGKMKTPASCETNFDCDRPMVCCDLIVAKVCCSSGMMIGVPQQGEGELGLQGSLIPIPIPVEKDEPFPGARNAPQGQQPW